jgi:copper chaperone CopZ
MTELTLRLEGLSCPTCASKVQDALTKKAGVQEANVNFPSGRVQVKYDPAQVEEADLRELIEDMGYDVLA